jgi:hypothetical protein
VDAFAFIIHPIDPKRDVSRKYPILGKYLSERQIDFFSTFFPPVYISEIEGIESASTGKQVKVVVASLHTKRIGLPSKRSTTSWFRPEDWQRNWGLKF